MHNTQDATVDFKVVEQDSSNQGVKLEEGNLSIDASHNDSRVHFVDAEPSDKQFEPSKVTETN